MEGYEYYCEHGFLLSNIRELTRVSTDKEFHVYGASGALGLSLLKLIDQHLINPTRVFLYSRASSDLTPWQQVLKRRAIVFECVELNDRSFLHPSGRPRVVVYFIGSAQPSVFLNDPKSSFELNVNLLLRVVETRPDYLFYSSTSELYTGINDLCTESTVLTSSPYHPRSSYIESKRAGEAILANLTAPSTRSVAFRIALATSPTPILGDRRVLCELIQMAKQQNQVVLSGGYDSIRQYQWGPFAVLKILYAGFFGKHALYNIGGGESLSLEEIGKRIARKFGVTYRRGEITALDVVKGAPQRVSISDARLRSEFNLELKDEKFDKMLEYYLG